MTNLLRYMKEKSKNNTKEEAVEYLMNETNLPYEECSKANDFYIRLNKTYKGEYIISLETPCNIGKDILNCRAELMEEGKKTGYILKDDNIIALIGYRE